MAEVNINPVANGNKTQSGINGALNAMLIAAIYAGLKHFGIENPEVTSLITGGVLNGVLAVVGVVHKYIKFKAAK